jgi:hypothetical protein
MVLCIFIIYYGVDVVGKDGDEMVPNLASLA